MFLIFHFFFLDGNFTFPTPLSEWGQYGVCIKIKMSRKQCLSLNVINFDRKHCDRIKTIRKYFGVGNVIHFTVFIHKHLFEYFPVLCFESFLFSSIKQIAHTKKRYIWHTKTTKFPLNFIEQRCFSFSSSIATRLSPM